MLEMKAAARRNFLPKMEEFTLIRDYKPEATLGQLKDGEGNVIIHTLERPNLHNQRDNPNTKENESSCIPEGSYICKKYSSPKYPDTWEITGVPHRGNILFHCANFVHQLKGCVATCTTVIDQNPNNVASKMLPEEKWRAAQSKDAFVKFHARMPQQFILNVTSLQSLCGTK